MFRKILAALIAVLIIPISTFAISVSDIQNNPNRYKYISQCADGAVYLDLDSVSSQRYSPPFYTLAADSYTVVYTKNCIIGAKFIFNYDYNHGRMTAIKNALDEMRKNNKIEIRNNKEYMSDDTYEEIKNRVNSQMKIDTGVRALVAHTTVWNLDGKYINARDSNNEMSAGYNTIPYYLAEEAFHKYYNQWF